MVLARAAANRGRGEHLIRTRTSSNLQSFVIGWWPNLERDRC